jgi:hypothetical protein
MTRKLEIEAKLDRSLRRQLPVPRLDASFNAAVWQRIAAQQAPAVARPERGSRWLLVSNALGIGVSVALVVYFAARGFAGVEVDANLALPVMPEQTTTVILQGLVWVITLVAVGFGFAFTRLGRRLRDFCRSEFT